VAAVEKTENGLIDAGTGGMSQIMADFLPVPGRHIYFKLKQSVTLASKHYSRSRQPRQGINGPRVGYFEGLFEYYD
jgi:hypothetical protein